MGEFKTVQDVWKAVDQGKTVYWSSTLYKIYICADDNPESTRGHEGRTFCERNGKLLEVRCIENYFGSILHESELGKLFTKETEE